MELKNERLGASFTVPDKPTVRQQLAYFSAVGWARGSEFFERYWQGAIALAQDWKCERLPDMRTSLDTITDPKVTEVILWAGIEVKRIMDALDEIPKNS